VALALGIAVLLTRRIAGGLKPIQARLNSLAENCLTDTERALTAMANEGDLTIEVVPVTTPADSSGTDEIAQIADTFNTMLEKAQSSIEAYNAMRQKRVEFADIVSKIADGDLTSQIHVASDKDQIGQAFSEMLDSLREMVAAAEQIADRDLSHSVELRSERDALGIAFNRMTENVSAV